MVTNSRYKDNCPNCGAPYEIDESKCPYCNTAYNETYEATDNERIFISDDWDITKGFVTINLPITKEWY